ncbi:MAG: tetratricopeptide repeat protein, partial [Betaproteobacteria bacterium]
QSTPDEVFPIAKAAVARALELDDTLSEGHATLAYIKTYYDWDWPGAEIEFKRSLALNSNDSTVLHWYSRYLASSGRIDEALTQIEHARELDPLEPGLKANVGVICYFGRRYDQAISELKELLKKDPEFSTAHWGLGLAYEQKKSTRRPSPNLKRRVASSTAGRTPSHRWATYMPRWANGRRH